MTVASGKQDEAPAATVYNSEMGTSPDSPPPIPQDLLDALVCPACRKPVRVVRTASAAAGLQCEECRRVFPIRDGIPIMLLDEATSEATAASDSAKS